MNPARNHMASILDAALAAVEPGAAVRAALTRKGVGLIAGGRVFEATGRVTLLAMGKAAVPMTRAALEIAGDLVTDGLAVAHAIPAGLDRLGPVTLREAGHPLPDDRSVEVATGLADLASSLGPDDLALVLLSGGASSLVALPAAGLGLVDLIAVTDALQRGGASIDELNAVRKHLSLIGGGQFARMAGPARVLVLALSDVPGDRLDVIASGPFAPDPSTYGEALAVIRRFGGEAVPGRVTAHLERGCRGELPETVEPGDPVFGNVTHVLVGSGATAAKAAAARASALGYDAEVATDLLGGEAREAGHKMAEKGRALAKRGRAACRVWHGETTVTVTGSGAGGRNQELALAAALELDKSSGVLLASLGTDGRDGPTDAAGGVVDGGSATRIRAVCLDPEALLCDNDANRALAAAGDLLVTGPTGTNVADLVVLLVGAT